MTFLEQARLWKLTFKRPTGRHSCFWMSQCMPEFPGSTWEIRKPALWFALRGRFTLGGFVLDRSFTWFVEMHWRRLLSQSNPDSFNKHWQQSYHDGRDRCRCPGHEFASLLAPRSFATLSDDVAEAVLREFMSHIDRRILQSMEPDLCQFEEYRRRASGSDLENWYTPKSPAGRWKRVSNFKAQAAVSDRLVGTFERIKNDPQVESMAWAELVPGCNFLAGNIKAW